MPGPRCPKWRHFGYQKWSKIDQKSTLEQVGFTNRLFHQNLMIFGLKFDDFCVEFSGEFSFWSISYKCSLFDRKWDQYESQNLLESVLEAIQKPIKKVDAFPEGPPGGSYPNSTMDLEWIWSEKGEEMDRDCLKRRHLS